MRKSAHRAAEAWAETQRQIPERELRPALDENINSIKEDNMAINIKGINKAEILAALYNAAKPQGMGFLQYEPAPMTAEEAAQYVGGDIDYLKGRVMKVNLTGDSLDTRLYNRDNGEGAAERVFASLSAKSIAAVAE